MDKLLLFDSTILEITLGRLCHQLAENHNSFKDTVLVGIQPRGIFFADRLQKSLKSTLGIQVPLGHLDVTFFRDDFRRRDSPLKANTTNIPFVVEDKKVLLIDDVLFTGRTIQAAMSALQAYGRPSQVELLVLVNRKYSRNIPIEPQYVGKSVNTILSQKVQVEWKEQGHDADRIWLISNSENV